MLGAHVVVDAVVAALKKRPKAFNTVGVSLVANIFTGGVVDANMIIAGCLKSDVCPVVVRDDCCSGFGVIADKPLQC